MRQYDEEEHSEVYLRIMKRRRRRALRRKAILAVFAAGTITTVAVCGFSNKEMEAGQIETAAETQAETMAAMPLDSLDLTTKVITILVEVQPETKEKSEELKSESEETEQPVHTKRLWTDKEAYLLAKLAMAEAESEDTESKALVIRTVLNRVQYKYFPDTIEEVIFQKTQFTPIWDGRWNRVEPDDDCWAALALVESGWDESQGALYFEVTTDEDTWHNRNLVRLFDHGAMTFYTEEDAE